MLPGSVTVGLEIASSACGLVGSLALLLTAWRSAPITLVLGKAAKLDPNGPAAEIKEAIEAKSNLDLTEIRLLERPMMLLGAALLVLSFTLSIVAKIFS